MKIKGFTLIELIVVMGILASLTTIVVIAVNPGRQFAASRNAKRASDVRAIAQALNQHAADNGGVLHSGITTTTQTIGTGVDNLNLTSILVPNYLSAIPKDPQNGTDANTKYVVYRDANNVVGVSASQSELTGTVTAGSSPNLALMFDGVNDCVTLQVGKSIPLTNEFTYEGWFKMDGPNESYDTLMGIGINHWDIRLHANTLTDIYAHVYPAQFGMTGFNLGDGNWHHIAIVYNSNAGWVRGYVDGVLRGDSSVTIGAAPSNTTANRWYLGCEANGRWAQTSIDVIRMSNVARYSSAFTPSLSLSNDANTVGLWEFSEGAGLTIRDSSSVGNHGTILDTQTWIVR